jgi:5-methylcytosine-specific restriction endonuclease McrA
MFINKKNYVMTIIIATVIIIFVSLSDRPLKFTLTKSSITFTNQPIHPTSYKSNSYKSNSYKSNSYKSKNRKNINNMTKKIVASKQKWRCNMCGNLLDASYEIDHINPLYKNGTNDIDNLQALCRNCHGTKTIYDVHI